jgi:hypothetical protein
MPWHPEPVMDDKESLLKQTEEKLKDAAKAVQDFADEVAAPEVPPVLIPDPDPPLPKPAASKKDG